MKASKGTTIHSLNLMEVLVIRYNFNIKKNNFTLITDYSTPQQSSNERIFMKLSFDKVSNYKRNSEQIVENRAFEIYHAEELKRTIVIQDFLFQENTSNWYAEFYLGHRLGEIIFNFESFLCLEKKAIAYKANDNWVYIDSATEKVIDFYNPFGDD